MERKFTDYYDFVPPWIKKRFQSRLSKSKEHVEEFKGETDLSYLEQDGIERLRLSKLLVEDFEFVFSNPRVQLVEADFRERAAEVLRRNIRLYQTLDALNLIFDVPIKLMSIVSKYGLEETEKMLELKERIVQSLREGELDMTSYKAYKTYARDILSQKSDKEGETISTVLLDAALFFEGRHFDVFMEKIDVAIRYVTDLGLNNTIEELSKIRKHVKLEYQTPQPPSQSSPAKPLPFPPPFD